MRKSGLLAVCLLAFWGCKAAPETSKYEAGDYVVYKYSGSYRPEPVILTEQVLSKTGGNKLEILVEWKSGKEIRTWKQFVTDTAYNRANNLIDRLVKIEGGKETELANKDNSDLFKLYEGTYLMPQHVPKLIKEERKTLLIGDESFICRVRTYNSKALGRHAEMTVADSDEFKWSNVSSSYRELKGNSRPFAYDLNIGKQPVKPQPLRSESTKLGGLLYAVEVLEHGNKRL